MAIPKTRSYEDGKLKKLPIGQNRHSAYRSMWRERLEEVARRYNKDARQRVIENAQRVDAIQTAQNPSDLEKTADEVLGSPLGDLPPYALVPASNGDLEYRKL